MAAAAAAAARSATGTGTRTRTKSRDNSSSSSSNNNNNNNNNSQMWWSPRPPWPRPPLLRRNPGPRTASKSAKRRLPWKIREIRLIPQSGLVTSELFVLNLILQVMANMAALAEESQKFNFLALREAELKYAQQQQDLKKQRNKEEASEDDFDLFADDEEDVPKTSKKNQDKKAKAHKPSSEAKVEVGLWQKEVQGGLRRLVTLSATLKAKSCQSSHKYGYRVWTREIRCIALQRSIRVGSHPTPPCSHACAQQDQLNELRLILKVADNNLLHLCVTLYLS